MQLEFPHFNGDDFDGWILRAQYYFEVDETLIDDWIKIAALHLECQAMQWHQGFMQTRNEVVLSWEEYTTTMRAKFGNYANDDSLVDLKNLK